MGLFYTQVFLPSRLFFPRRVFRTCNEAGQQNLRRKTLDREMQASPFFLPPLPCIIAGSRTTARATQVSIACIITITSGSERGVRAVVLLRSISLSVRFVISQSALFAKPTFFYICRLKDGM